MKTARQEVGRMLEWRSWTSRVLAGTLVVSIGVFAASAKATTEDDGPRKAGYSIVGLGVPNASTAEDVNRRGQVVGVSQTAFVYRDGGLTNLPTLGGPFSVAWAINDRGDIVGTSELASGFPNEHAFLYRRGQLHDLGTLGGAFSQAKDINNKGTIVGSSWIGFGQLRAFVYRDGVMTALLPDTGGATAAEAVNERGQIVGSAGNHAFVYDRRVTKDLGTLGGPTSEAKDINDRGQVVGSSNTATGSISAFLYTDGAMRDVGTVAAYAGSLGEAINNRGQVVGELLPVDSDDPTHAFLYSRGKLRDLNDLLPPDSGWELNFALGINDRGQIVGVGVHDGLQRGFLMTPGEHDDDEEEDG
jgi:probable HAF family extracellular repeat protein